MKLTDKDVELFKGLQGSGLGQAIIEYCERLMTDLCDIRTMNGVEETTRLARIEAVELINNHLVQRIKLAGEDKQINNSQYV